ncbi:unnamed protein product [Rotaria sp. Silwood1]|nr:unnamed protein product [Rotaria sp. Silwood1]CAF5012504.1 unnamed protein product [Rotaria sp. Silwood1]
MINDQNFAAKDLLKQLNDYHKLFQMYSVEPIIVQQLFKQIFYIIDAQALRGLLVTKLLSLYKSMDDYDDQVTPALIKRASDLLKQQRLGSTIDQTKIDYEQQENFDLSYTFPLVYPYVSSTVSLDQLDIPHELHLDFLSLV